MTVSERLAQIKWLAEESKDRRNELVDAIRQAASEGVTQEAISEAAGLSRQRIGQILKGR